MAPQYSGILWDCIITRDVISIPLIIIIMCPQARAPHSPVIIVGTHVDRLPPQKSRELKEHYKQRIVQLYRKPGYPNIESIRMVSCVSQEGLRDLTDRIYYAAVSAIDHDTKEHVIGMQVSALYTVYHGTNSQYH